MNKTNKIMNVSLHPFDLINVGNEIRKMISAGIKNFHIDIMDGEFVHNFALCQKFVEDFKKNFTNCTLEAHMMIKNPLDFIIDFSLAKTDIYTFHIESCDNDITIQNIISEIKKTNMKVGIMLNLDTDLKSLNKYLSQIDRIGLMSIQTGFPGQNLNPSIINKLKELVKIKKQKNLNFEIEVDGGVRENTYQDLCASGAEILVVGHFLFEKDYKIQREKIEGEF